MKSLALVVAMTVVSAGQAGGAAIAGLWTAQFEGRTFLTLELKRRMERLLVASAWVTSKSTITVRSAEWVSHRAT
jgi:hypothetical protein